IRGRHALARGEEYQARAITEADGTRVTVWQTPAARADGPVIAFFYGNAGAVSDFAAIGAAFHRQGYGVLLASYRGYP
ncbi:hypothetical protein Q5L94_14225, partial [Idiomarina sp. Sol25]|uniref:hypothetical protein n=1 Tax=Idiomarina sp. Sol25 TaxID=3064000 RepID=UPI00294B4C70